MAGIAGSPMVNFTLKDDAQLINKIGIWQLYLGDKNNITEREFSAMVSLLKTSFPQITLKEFELCMNLSMMGKFGDDINQLYGRPLNISFIIKNITAYIKYRREELHEILEEEEKIALKRGTELPAPTPESDMQMMKDLLQLEYDKFTAGGKISDPFSFCYHYLDRTKRIVLTPEQRKEAGEYGKKRAADILDARRKTLKQEAKPIGDVIDGMSQMKLSQMFARNYCVEQYFKTVNFEKLLKSVKASEFIEEKKNNDENKGPGTGSLKA